MPTETGRMTSPMARAWLLDIYLAALIVATFVVDQVSKGWVRDHLVLGDSIPAEGFFRFTHTSNTGSIFGLFPNQTTLLMLASILGIGVLLLFFRKQPISPIWLRTSLGLQLGGAAGNLADRITLGKVTDFIDVGVWPVFNMADSSIIVGLTILAWFLLRSPKELPRAEVPPAPDERGALLPSSSEESDVEG
ncbi:signal peptidase II [Chloroflexota bacterium]